MACHLAQVASMGPLFFRAENRSSSPIAWPRGPKLQWGRSFSERRTCLRRRSRAARNRFNGAALFQSGEPASVETATAGSHGFNGAALFQSGEPDRGRVFGPRGRASMGPLFFRAENGTGLRGSSGEFGASMGPLFFRAENQWWVSERHLHHELQWGRSFSERRTFGLVHMRRGDCRFNGAALFQSGEHSSVMSPSLARSASMGPLFFRAENVPKLAPPKLIAPLQWGRSFSERRTATAWPFLPAEWSLQWGRSFSERRTATAM